MNWQPVMNIERTNMRRNFDHLMCGADATRSKSGIISGMAARTGTPGAVA